MKSPRILLLHPHNPLEGYHYPVPQVALGYISASLKENGFQDIHIKDALLEKYEPDQVVEYVQFLQPDLIGLRIWSHQMAIAREYILKIKKILPKVKIVVGGPHPTVSPESTGEDFLLSSGGADFAFSGEAEEGFPMLTKHLFQEEVSLEKIPGLIWRENDKLRMNAISKIDNLDQYKVDWDALDLPRYHQRTSRTTSYDHGKKKNAFIFMTRGCPYPCTYCAAGLTNGKKIRSHSPKRIVDDIEYLYKKYGVRHFNIMDDNFTFYRETVLGFCEEFERRRSSLPGVSFHNPNGVRVDRIDEEVLIKMKACGWKWLHIGIESGSKNTLTKMRKRLDLDLALKNISLIKKHKLKCWGFFMIGFWDESKEEIDETIDWAIRSKLHAATFSIFSPIPGTAVYKDMQKQGLIKSDYMMSGYMSTKSTVFAKGLNSSDLKKIQRNALAKFYSRPDRALHLLRGMDLSTISNRVIQLFSKA